MANQNAKLLIRDLGLFDPNDTKPGESASGIIHSCDLCGKRGRWNKKWAWFGSYGDMDAEVVLKSCGCASPTETEGELLLAEKRTRLGLRPKVRRVGYHFE